MTRPPEREAGRARAIPVRVLRAGAAVSAVVCALGAAAVRVDAASTSKTASSKTASSKTAKAGATKPGGRVSANATATTPTTATLKPRQSGTPVTGFGRLASDDWPAPGDAVIAASIGKSVEILRAPDDRTGALKFDEGRSVSGPVRLLAVGAQGAWVRVVVPVRPNGTVGWVRAQDVTLARTPLRIEIELDTNTMRLYNGNSIAIETTVAAGTGGTPTPTGLFFVKERVPQANPNGALGPVALGLSGFSTVLQTFAGGFGTIAIHGTNAPGKLGGDVSHGCIRVANDVITQIAATVPIGTPVEIAEHFTDLPVIGHSSEWLDAVANGAQGAAVMAAANPAGGEQNLTQAALAGAATAAPDGQATIAPAVTVPAAVPVAVPVASLLTTSLPPSP